MNEQIALYSFVRFGYSISTTHVESVDIKTDPSGQQAVSLRIRIEETLWSENGAPLRRCEFVQPNSETARLKFPHPIWGRVNLREGVRLFLVTSELTEMPAEPRYVEEIGSPNDLVLSAIRAILENERTEHDGKAHFARYLRYLTEGTTVEKLFGAEALAKDLDLPNSGLTTQVAIAMATTFSSDPSIYVRLSVGSWMWESVYLRTDTVGKVAVINATINGVENPSQDIRRFSIERLMLAAPADLTDAEVIKDSEAVRVLQEQLQLETAPEVRDRIQQVIAALQA